MVKQKYCLSLHHQTKNLVFGESVAQQVEHNTFNVGVPGSSPGGFTSFYVERQSFYSAAFFVMFYFEKVSTKTQQKILAMQVARSTTHRAYSHKAGCGDRG